MWFDYDLSWYGFLHVYAVQDFAFLNCNFMSLTNVGKFKAIIQIFFFFLWKGLKRETLTFHLSFCII